MVQQLPAPNYQSLIAECYEDLAFHLPHHASAVVVHRIHGAGPVSQRSICFTTSQCSPSSTLAVVDRTTDRSQHQHARGSVLYGILPV